MARQLAAVAVSFLLAPAVIAAVPESDQAAVEKSAFHLLNPTPAAYLRPMTIDGPGATESPYTVDAGHFQIEMTLFGYGSDVYSSQGVTYRSDWWTVGPANLKIGLFNALDLQLVLTPYTHIFEREEDYYRDTRDGFGDTTLRAKYNLWGNDRGPTALALTPFVTFPTSAPGVGNAKFQGGLMVPFAVALPCDFHLGVTAGFVSAENFFSSGRHAEFRNSLALARELFWDLEGYVEFSSATSTERDAGWTGTFDSGLTYWLADNLQLSAGFDLGVTREADDSFGFVSMAWRY